MNLPLSLIKTLAFMSLGFAFSLTGKQALAQDPANNSVQTKVGTKPEPTQPTDVKTAKSSNKRKTEPKISPLPLARPVELGDRPTRTLNRFALVPSTQAETTSSQQTASQAAANSHDAKACPKSEIKGKEGKRQKAVTPAKTKKEKDC